MLGSLYPEMVDERLRLYKTSEACPSDLSPIERQVICYVTSLLNGTAHCASGLRLTLEGLGCTAEVIDAIDAHPEAPHTGDARLDALAGHAAKLTLDPTNMTADDLELLRSHGFSDLDLIDVNNRVAYYNYVNRIVMGLGLRTVKTRLEEAENALPGERVVTA
jgi:uncharacterized peroxidase-related enzyme